MNNYVYNSRSATYIHHSKSPSVEQTHYSDVHTNDYRYNQFGPGDILENHYAETMNSRCYFNAQGNDYRSDFHTFNQAGENYITQSSYAESALSKYHRSNVSFLPCEKK